MKKQLNKRIKKQLEKELGDIFAFEGDSGSGSNSGGDELARAPSVVSCWGCQHGGNEVT